MILAMCVDLLRVFIEFMISNTFMFLNKMMFVHQVEFFEYMFVL